MLEGRRQRLSGNGDDVVGVEGDPAGAAASARRFNPSKIETIA
jgi:hypothetical protein